MRVILVALIALSLSGCGIPRVKLTEQERAKVESICAKYPEYKGCVSTTVRDLEYRKFLHAEASTRAAVRLAYEQIHD